MTVSDITKDSPVDIKHPSSPMFPDQRMTKISVTSLIFSLADITIVNFQSLRPLMHYLPLVYIWNVQFFLWLTTLAAI